MKKMLALLLALGLLLSLAACGGNDDNTVNPNPTPEPDPEEPIVLDFSNASLPIGDKLTITATTDDDSAVTWSSSDPTIASVDANGVGLSCEVRACGSLAPRVIVVLTVVACEVADLDAV